MAKVSNVLKLPVMRRVRVLAGEEGNSEILEKYVPDEQDRISWRDI